MTRRGRILRNIALGLLAFVVVVGVAGILIVQSDWFRDFVKRKIIASTEDGTGGTVEIGSFQLDWKHLRLVASDFVIRGSEPPSGPPFVRAARVQLDARLFTSIQHVLDIGYLGVESPQANIIVFPDGRTNVPTPKPSPKAEPTAIETAMDFAVGRFELNNGLLIFESRKQVLNVRGNNLHAQLWFDVLKQGYSGDLSFEPVYVASGRNTPVRFALKLPLSLRRDRIEFHNASITTPKTSVLIDGSVENMRDPKITAHINGHIALVDLKDVSNLPIESDARNVPAALDLDANATIANNGIQVTGLRLGLGQSNLEASGILKDPKGNGALEFKSRLALGELGRMAKLAARPEGTVVVNGTARLDANNNYDVGGNIQARNLLFRQGAQYFKDLNLISAVHLDPHNVDLKGLRLSALGGEFAGDIALQDFARYQLRGNLRGLNLRTAASGLEEKQFAYSGTLSGPVEATGELKSTPVTKSLAAHAKLLIAPSHEGIPLSGLLNLDYIGSNDNLRLKDSYLTLPHTRLDLDGSVGNQLNVSLTTTDVNDLLKSSVNLNHRQATFKGTVTGKLQAPLLAGHLTASGFSVEDRKFDSLAVDVAASNTGASVHDGVLTRGRMHAQFSGHVGLKDWLATPEQPLSADLTLSDGDVADLLALAGEDSQDYSGAVGATVHIGGAVGNPTGSAKITASHGTILNEPFDQLQAQVNLADQSIAIPTAFLQSGSSRVNLTAEFHHPRDSFTTGQLHAHVQSNAVDLAEIRNLQMRRPNTAGTLQLNTDINGTLSTEKQFTVAGVTGDASVRGLRFEGDQYGDISANARTAGQTVAYNLTSNFAGSNIRVTGNTQLVPQFPTTADATIGNLPVERLLRAVERQDIPVKGSLSGTAHFSGTWEKPEGSVDIDVAKAEVYDEPLDRVHAKASYLANVVEVQHIEIAAGPARLEGSGRFDHPPGNLQAGNLQFRIDSSNIDLASIRNLQTRRPGLGGTFQLAASGKAEIRDTDPRVVVQDLSANIAANKVSLQGKNYGDAKLTASSENGKVNFVLASNLAGASIQGRGSAQITNQYPVDAQLTFSNLAWTRLGELIGRSTAQKANFELTTDGQVTVQGPLLKVDEIRGSAQLTKFQFASIPVRRDVKPVTLQNLGPISATLDRQLVRIDSAHLIGPQTGVQAKGAVSLRDRSLDLTVNADANLALLQEFDRNILSSGSVTLATAVRGTIDNPLVNGKLEIKNGSLNYATVSNGIANANGVVIFNGNSASIRNMTAESGGGKVTLSGFATLNGDNPRFSLRANGTGVRVRVEQGASVVADANVNLSGTLDRSQLSGTATITQIAYAPQTDIGSLLTRAAPPLEASEGASFLDNMKLDVRIRTSDAMLVQTSLADSLQAQADVRIRGTASHPGALGRVTITEGTITFFNATYTVNSGTIGFYNPLRIDPVMDISLETQSQGVDVTVRVTGPVDNMKLSYTSDPPLQFQEIISLLASGKTPTSDPTILANQPVQPPQNFQQIGESAILGSALADPISSRLQRVFGVSQLRIDPTFTSGSELPQAQVTLQQRVTNNITFTYVTALDDPNSQTIQVQMTLNPQWSAVATRDQNGIFSVNLLYRRQVR